MALRTRINFKFNKPNSCKFRNLKLIYIKIVIADKFETSNLIWRLNFELNLILQTRGKFARVLNLSASLKVQI